MKTELLALIESYGKALVHQTEGKISAFKDAKNLMSNIVFLLDKAEQEQAPAAVAMPDAISSLTGDTALAHEQCRAVVHLALAVAEVYSSNALIVANDARLADQIGAASAEVMEYLGDTLNSTDATTEEDEWLEPIFEAAQERWPAAAQAAPADALTHTELLEIRRATEDFESHGETDVDDELLIRGALAGYLECTHFQLLNESALELDIQNAAQAAQMNGGA